MGIEPDDLKTIQVVLNEYNAFFEEKEDELKVVKPILDRLQTFVDKSDIDYEMLSNIAVYMAGHFKEDITNVTGWDWTTEALYLLSPDMSYYPNLLEW